MSKKQIIAFIVSEASTAPDDETVPGFALRLVEKLKVSEKQGDGEVYDMKAEASEEGY